MHKHSRLLLAALLLLACAGGCNNENDVAEPETFSFVVYPGARYLQPLTDVTKQAHKTLKPNADPPPIAIYDTDASVEDVANFYAKSYGYNEVAADATNNMSASKPPAYYRAGDLGADAQAIAPLLQKMGTSSDVSKAVGTYRAAEIEPRLNRPRVTVQRPYFDVTSSQVVDKTLILMSR
ncbi:MAG TPA: hypothetical protein VF698_06080 [Thermoanaerobaculia bacterium]|jgi:hypothetical protein